MRSIPSPYPMPCPFHHPEYKKNPTADGVVLMWDSLPGVGSSSGQVLHASGRAAPEGPREPAAWLSSPLRGQEGGTALPHPCWSLASDCDPKAAPAATDGRLLGVGGGSLALASAGV
jgi:hypothetical protein